MSQMISRRVLTIMFVVCSGCFSAEMAMAGKFNPVRNIGDKAPTFDALPATDNKTYSLADFADSKVLVIAFTCNSCPYAVDYEERLSDFTRTFADRTVAVIAINCNLVKGDLLPEMKQRAGDRKFPFVYLFDESQQIARDFGALRTPEFYVLDADRKIVYMGAFDDNTDAAEVKTRYVADAVEAVLAGKPVATPETPPVGCLIRFKRTRGNPQ